MKKNLLFFLLLAAGTGVFAQTKKIAFKSHSGSAENFSVALEDGLFDMDNSNFGRAPDRDIVNAQLDSVIFVCDTLAILVTSEYCTRTRPGSAKPVSEPKLWKAGRESAFFHPLFSRKHSLDSIRMVLKEQYGFKNPIDKVVFVGYDNKEKKYRGFTTIPSAGSNNDKGPFDGPVILITSLIVALSLLVGLVAWKLYKPARRGYQQVAIGC